ncbi:MAG: DUF5058 family protein [Mogibacterium sp.]|nr:DUF5058 family protein [Mogibacterium sp.]
MDAMQIANSIPMWVACAIPVGLIIFQAFLFMNKARQACNAIGYPDEKVKQAIKSSAITSIGPSLVILSGMLSLLITVGGPVGWMRLSLIGSVMFESIAAGIGTQQVGVTLGTDPMTPTALAMAVWTMVLCSIGWVIFATFSASRMEKIQHKITGGSTKRMAMISGAAIIGCFASFVGSHLVKFNAELGGFYFSKNAVAAILGALIMFVMLKVSAKNKKLAEWNLFIAMISAMILTAVLPIGK